MKRSSDKKNIYYLSFSYYPSGVFKSQIIDVIKLLRSLSNHEIRLISFFSVRVFFKCRKWLKRELPDAIVLPIVFGMKRWEWHSRMLRFFVKKSDFIIGRNPMGAKIGLNYFDNVVFDGRSALIGEISEYDMALNSDLNASFIRAEDFVVNHSKYRLSVSSALVNFWKNEMGYRSDNHLIIPCSLAYSHEKKLEERPSNSKVKLLFSGGGSPWQSDEKKYRWIRKLLESRDDLDFVFLTKSDEALEKLIHDYPKRVDRKWLKAENVFEELSKADYGILLREDNLTNNVSAPVKFAEYLNAGLKVIISSSVLDYADFVKKNDCGIVIENWNSELVLKPLSNIEREANRSLAQKYFSKNGEQIRSQYQKLLKLIDG